MENTSTEIDLVFEKQIKTAYKKFEDMYAAEKSKKYVLHLIKAFLPINEFNFFMNTDKKCSILNLKGFSTNKFIEITSDSVFARAALMIGTEEEQAEANKKLDKVKNELNAYFKPEEGENLLQSRKLYFSEKSDSTICLPALIALRDFAINTMLRNDKPVTVAIKSKQFESTGKVTKKEANVVAMKSVGYTLSEANEDVFAKLKERFKN